MSNTPKTTQDPSDPKDTGNKTAYMVDSIKVNATVNVMGKEIQLPLSDLADGCIGVSLWFDTIEHATEWADDNDKISTATYEPKEQV